jgi:hypothetical protein
MRHLGIAWIASQAKRGTRQRFTVLRDAPLITEIERSLDRRGFAWSARYDAMCATASLSLFGITEADVRPREPHPDDVDDPTRTAFMPMSDEAFAAYDQRLGAWFTWNQKVAEYETAVVRVGIVRYWHDRGFDVSDGHGEPLRCLDRFSRQLYAATKGLLPGATLTLDGSGKRAAQTIEDWAAALEQEAKRFRPGSTRGR